MEAWIGDLFTHHTDSYKHTEWFPFVEVMNGNLLQIYCNPLTFIDYY